MPALAAVWVTESRPSSTRGCVEKPLREVYPHNSLVSIRDTCSTAVLVPYFFEQH